MIKRTRAKTTHNKLLKVSSRAFENNMEIPAKYTSGGKNLNPPLTIKGIPLEAKSLAIIMINPNAPYGKRLHWIVWNIPVTHQIKEGMVPGKHGLNNFDSRGYHGPFKKRAAAIYNFKIYALDCVLKKIDKNIKKHKLESAMAGHIIGYGEITGCMENN